MDNKKPKYTKEELGEAEIIATIDGKPVLVLNSISCGQESSEASNTKKE